MSNYSRHRQFHTYVREGVGFSGQLMVKLDGDQSDRVTAVAYAAQTPEEKLF